MVEGLRDFYDCLNREERKLSDDVAADSLGLLMRIAINELDLDFEGVHLDGAAGEADQERSYIMRLGAVRVIKLAMHAHRQFDAPAVTVQRYPGYSNPVLAMIGRAGAIEHGRRVAQSLAAKEGRIEKLGERFRIVLPAALPDLELHERELERRQVAHYRRRFLEGYASAVGARIGDDVRSLLTELVYPFREHFIGYEANPTLDFYFFGLAYNEMLLAKGYDTFHFSTVFGGQTFEHYRLAATFIVFVGLKHRAFVQALLEKDASIRIEDVLTVSVETAGYLEDMRDFINEFGARFEGHVPIADEGVLTVFGVLSVSRENVGLLDRPGSPIPPLVQCSENHVIRPLAGAASEEVMLFLLNSLQQRFPRDYDRAQRTREGVLQRALEGVLRSIFPDLVFRANIKLRQAGGVLTDLDLVIADPAGAHLLLAQLKHQDPYGADMATMLARTERLNRQVGDWLYKVRSWLSAASSAELCATLRLPTPATRPKVDLLVLTRHYAHSLRTAIDGGDATFCNWNQLGSAVDALRRGERAATLSGLLDALRGLSIPEVEEHLPEPPSAWIVGDLSFTIEQAEDL